MHKFSHSIFASFLVITIIGTTFFYAPKTARADIIGDIVGYAPCKIYLGIASMFESPEDYAAKAVEDVAEKAENKVTNKAESALEGAIDPTSVPVHDGELEQSTKDVVDDNAETINKKQENVSEYEGCKETVRKTVLSILKRQILDVMVNDIVEWIQTGESFGDLGARFTQSWEKTMENVKQEAIGELAIDLGLGFLCKPFSFKIQLQLAKPQKFTHRAACTLDRITGNIKNFGKRFDAGGWPAYREVLKPQNNLWGARLLVQDELVQREEKKVVSKKQELQAGAGFSDQKICTRWERQITYDKNNVKENENLTPGGYSSVAEIKWIDDYYSKELPPREEVRDYEYGIKAATEWTCANKEGITPGRVIGEAATKTIGHDFDFIINADDLADYLTAISDALINRLTKESIAGLSNLYDEARSSPARGNNKDKYSNDHPGIKDSVNSYTSTTIGSAVANIQNAAYTDVNMIISRASTTISVVKTNYENTKAKNNNLKTLISKSLTPPPPGLIACYEHIINSTNNASSTFITNLGLLPQASSTLEMATIIWDPKITQGIASTTQLEAQYEIIKNSLAQLSSNNQIPQTLINDANQLKRDIGSRYVESGKIFNDINNAFTQKLGEQTLYAPWCQ